MSDQKNSHDEQTSAKRLRGFRDVIRERTRRAKVRSSCRALLSAQKFHFANTSRTLTIGVPVNGLNVCVPSAIASTYTPLVNATSKKIRMTPTRCDRICMVDHIDAPARCDEETVMARLVVSVSKYCESLHISGEANGSHPFADVNTGLDHLVHELALSGFEPVSSIMPSLYPFPAQLDAEYAMKVRPPQYMKATIMVSSNHIMDEDFRTNTPGPSLTAAPTFSQS
jgi:hypothetical protein